MSRIPDAARAIRPYLSDLLTEEAAARTDAALAELLMSDRHDREDLIIAEFDRNAPTRDWAAEFMVLGVPPEVAHYYERSFEDPPGHGDPVRVPRFTCPQGDYTWYRLAVGEQPPLCKTHGTVLEPADP